MLTLELVSTRRRGDSIEPYYIAPEDPTLISVAQNLIQIYIENTGKSREILDSHLDNFLGEGKDLVVYRGLSKLLEDRCTFEMECPLDPVSIRQTIFETASKSHQSGTFDRAKIIADAASQFGVSEAILENVLYADLKQYQVLKEFQPIPPLYLLRRYNTALAQAILLRAVSLKITIQEQNHLRYRQLFRAIKFFRLLYQITGTLQEGFKIDLDGPMSMFQLCSKYGLQMALFLPALLLCGNWHLDAQLRWGHSPKTYFFRLGSRDGLYSHYPDTGMYEPPEMLVFKDRFAQLESGWDLYDECSFLEIESQQICIPDYKFVHRETKCTVFLEIFGFWRKAMLEKRMDMLARCPYNLLHAIPEKWSVDKDSSSLDNERLYFFHEVLNPKEVLKRLDNYCQKHIF